jgi:hypothetical protein
MSLKYRKCNDDFQGMRVLMKWALLRQCIFVLGAGGAKSGLREAMWAIAEAITQCKFESSDPGSDEVILFKILQVCPI